MSASAPFVFEQLDTRSELVLVSGSPVDRAAEIVAEANARAAEIERAAREAGYEAGRAEALVRVEAELGSSRAALAAALAAAGEARDRLAAALEPRVIELAITLAEKIVSASLELRPELVCEVVGSALRRTLARDELVIDVNPDDAETVRGWLDARGEAGQAIEVHAERRVARGGCVIRTSEGEIDAQVAEQLARAELVLRRALEEGRP